jgi:MinD superfamily P-loop ATPase
MRIAIASGKGGTGKTTIAVNLAVVAARGGRDVTYVDCDVEEPNGHIFLKPDVRLREPVATPVPHVDERKCTHCGECGTICQFKAIVVILDKVITFPELCHGCGGCTLVCPEGAITEVPRETGKIEMGRAVFRGEDGPNGGVGIDFIQGVLDVSEPMAPPVVRKVKDAVPHSGLTVIDAPPGTSCPVVETVRGVDFVLLVTEPTPFGLNDLKIAVDMIRQLDVPMGVVINRSDIGDGKLLQYCEKEHIEILARIPDDRKVAEVYSRGDLAALEIPEFRALMDGLLSEIFSRFPEGEDPQSAAT